MDSSGRKRRWAQFRISTVLLLILAVASFYAGRYVQSPQLKESRKANFRLKRQLKSAEFATAYAVQEAVKKREQQIWRDQAIKRWPILGELEASKIYVHYKDGEVYLINYCNAIGTNDDELVKLHNFPALHTLSLEQTGIGGDGLSHVAKLLSLNELWLDSCTNIRDEDLALLTVLPHLTDLRLPGTNVTDAGLVHVAKMTHLTSLCLHGTKVSDDGLAHLTGLPNLEFLWVSYTDVTDDGLQHLANFPKLKWLAIEGSQITEQGIERLREKIPNLKTPPS